MTATNPAALPGITELVALVKTHGVGALDAYAPAIDQYADTAHAGIFLGIKPASITRKSLRSRADGTPDFPPADARFGRSPVWTYRTLVVHRATMPGHGGATRWKPGQSGRISSTESVSTAPKSSPR